MFHFIYFEQMIIRIFCTFLCKLFPLFFSSPVAFCFKLVTFFLRLVIRALSLFAICSEVDSHNFPTLLLYSRVIILSQSKPFALHTNKRCHFNVFANKSAFPSTCWLLQSNHCKYLVFTDFGHFCSSSIFFPLIFCLLSV